MHGSLPRYASRPTSPRSTTMPAVPSSNLAIRANPLVWNLRLAQTFTVFAVLAISAANITEWHALSCTTPPKLQANIGCALLTLPILLYLLSTTGRRRLACLPWHPLPQLALDALLITLWTPFSLSPRFSCAAVCTACRADTAAISPGSTFHVWIGKLTCSCYVPALGETLSTLRKMAVAVTRHAHLRPGRGGATTKVMNEAGLQFRRWVDWVMVSLLVVTFVLTVASWYQVRRGGDEIVAPYAVEEWEEKKAAQVSVEAVDSTPSSPREERSGYASPS